MIMFECTNINSQNCRSILWFLLLLLLLTSQANAQRYELHWSDEFEDSTLSLQNWTYRIGTTYNNEYQYYTNRDTNVFVQDGYLHLVGLRESYGVRNWTSGRIRTQDKMEFQYGKVEIRAKLPSGKGLWPAFWMLGSNINEVGWPYSGEVDIMEYRGHITNQTSGTIHFSAVTLENAGTANGDRRYIGEDYDLPDGDFSTDFHLFQFEWSDSLMIWYIDDVEFFRLTDENIKTRTNLYPFDQPFYLLLNLAIGGNSLGTEQPDGSTPDRNEVIVDYVRVYQDANKPPEIEPGSNNTIHTTPYELAELAPTITDPDGSVEYVEMYINNNLIYADSTAPFTTHFRPVIDGCYKLSIKAKDNDNGISWNDEVTFINGSGCTRTPYFGEAIQIPGTLEFEYFDFGGPGISYSDVSPDTNSGASSGNDLRLTEGVDIIPDSISTGNYLITDTRNNEWTSYSVNVTETGYYDIEIQLVPGSEVGRLDLLLNGDNWLTFSRLVKQDSSYYTTKTLPDMYLEQGEHIITLLIAQNGEGIKPDNATFTLTKTTSTHPDLDTPGEFSLHQNFPNPFNPSTIITFELKSAGFVNLTIFDITGRKIKTLINRKLNAGEHTYNFEAENLPSGVYVYSLTYDNTYTITRKMTLLK